MTMLTKQQEERFDKKLKGDHDGTNSPRLLSLGCYECGNEIDPDGVKEHLAEELSLQLSEIIQIAEGMYKKYANKYKKLPSTYEEGCMDALDNLISTLTTLKEGK